MIMKYPFYLLLFFNVFNFIIGIQHKKCCDITEQVVDINGTLFCQNVTNARIEINNQNFEFEVFYEKNDGKCIDIIDDSAVKHFEFTNGNLSIIKEYLTDFFPKCCPLNFEYNTTNHACTKTNRSDTILIPETFVRVGLKNCKIIHDKIVNNPVEKNSNGNYLIKELNLVLDSNEFCWDKTLSSKYIVRICENDFDLCQGIRCIKKCCPDGQSFVNGPFCHDTYIYGIDLHSSKRIEDPNAPFAIIHDFKHELFILYEENYNFTLDSKGRFNIYHKITDEVVVHEHTVDTYCFEHVNVEGYLNGYTFFHSTEVKPPMEVKIRVTRWVKCISCFFLFLTVMIYLLLPNMRNLFGNILLSYSVATFIVFFFLTLLQFLLDIDDFMCKFLGFCVIFANLSSMTWMNIMCIDIWRSFGHPRRVVGSLQKKQLLQYSIYGWGFPLVWVLLIFFFNQNDILPESIHPYIGTFKCYFEDHRPGNYGKLFFFVLPVIIQQVFNTVFFIKTVLYCLEVKSEITKLNDSNAQGNNQSDNAKKEKLILLFKLGIIMGISFLFESASSVYNFNNNKVTRYIEVVWDSINCLQGVFIFIIFICKRKVYLSFCQRFNLRTKKISNCSSVTVPLSSLNITSTYRK